ncbi:aminotransferase [Paracoccus suum]|nr:aminotransferase [Paracoccus suum]
MEARGWMAEADAATLARLINVSQAAPIDPPPEGLRHALADAALNRPEAHLYGPVLGNDPLRAALAARWSERSGGAITAENVAITQGCNQAFCAVMATLVGAGDEVIIPVPWYFNHKMWLDMQGARAVPLSCPQDMVPRPEDAAALITPRTRAIVLVTPNNPSGAEYPAGILAAFRDLARQHGIALVLDETYADFDSRTEPGAAPVHDLLQDPDWGRDVISLYSFSKAYRLTGHRVGAIIASPERLVEVEKFLDTVAISASQMGQIGALWGLENLGDWLAGERREILARRDAMAAALGGLPGWRLKGCGAYFAWAEHPYAEDSSTLARRLVREAGLLLLPGTMFMPDGSAEGARHVRIAFANVDRAGIADMAARLADLGGARLVAGEAPA